MSGHDEYLETRGRDAFRMGPGAVALGYVLKYSMLFAYGVHATIVEVPSFVDVGGGLFAFVWAAIVAVVSAVAIVAVVRSWLTGRVRFEKYATATLCLTFIVYSIVLLVRGVLLENWSGVSLVWLPVALTVFPAIRYYSLVGR